MGNQKVILEATRLGRRGFGEKQVFSDINFICESGQVICISGPSGSGKTTLLRILAFLDSPSEGSVLLSEQHTVIAESTPKGTSVKKSCYPTVCLMSQEGGLWPHLTMGQNIELVAQGRENNPLIEKWLKTLRVDLILSQTPDKCSGGERQRVELIRALASCPGICLLDEPVAALDDDMERVVSQVLREAVERMNVGFVIVSHSEEVFASLVKDRMFYSLLKLENGSLSENTSGVIGDDS